MHKKLILENLPVRRPIANQQWRNELSDLATSGAGPPRKIDNVPVSGGFSPHNRQRMVRDTFPMPKGFQSWYPPGFVTYLFHVCSHFGQICCLPTRLYSLLALVPEVKERF